MFKPRLDILPAAQRRLWSHFRALPETMVLYGGTAIALQLGHRESVDFDFFTPESLDKESLKKLPGLSGFVVTADQENTLSGITSGGGDPVKLSFFGGMQRVPYHQPLLTSDGVLRVASLPELLGYKLKALFDRAEGKDYQDIAAILDSGVFLPAGMEIAQKVFPGFAVAQALRALSYHDDLHENWRLSNEARLTLNNAVAEYPLPTFRDQNSDLEP